MAAVIETQDYDPTKTSADVRHWVYCGLDNCVTGEILPLLKTNFTPDDHWVYEFELHLQQIAMEMMLFGVRVDDQERRRLIIEYEEELKRMESFLDQMAEVIWGKGLNARSSPQLQEFFYTVLAIPVQYKKNKYGQRTPTCDEKALLKISDYLRALPFVNTILAIRELGKFLLVLRSGVDGDGRMRFELAPASTETGRWASRKNAAGGGQNSQNITDRMRRIFVPDDDYFFAYADLEQAESRGVAYYSNDEAYIAACETGDLHAGVSRTMWPDKDPHAIWHKHLTYRDASKRCGHGTNYEGTAYGVAKAVGLDVALVEGFQKGYFETFPGIPRWHKETAQELQANGFLKTVYGRTRHFFDRLDSESTIKEAIAHRPQSTVCDYLSQGLIEIRNQVVCDDFRVLLQTHDALLFQVRLGRWDLLERARELMLVKCPFPSGKTMVIPNDVKVGFNWGKQSAENPNGLGESLEGKKLELGSVLKARL